MSLRNAQMLNFVAAGVTDSVDGTNAPAGSMMSLANLVAAPGTPHIFVPRPAAEERTDFSGFSTPAEVTALLVIGSLAYGMIASAAFAGKDQPFCYDIANDAFVTISGQVSGNLPTTQSTSGDWAPPTMAMIGTRIMVTHPGFSGANKVGFIDISSFTSNTITGTTHTSTLIDTLSANPITAGWMPGMTISGTGIPAGAYIVSLTATSVIISAATSSGGAGVTLTVAGGTLAAPLWGAGTTNTNPLTAVPKAVFNYNNRAWYAVDKYLVYSDALSPMQVTNATQAVTLGDNTAVTALGGVPLGNVVAGGIIQGLVAFKGAGSVWQVTGDAATSNLTVNIIAGAPGTLAPRTVCATPRGLAYVAPDGLRIIDTEATVSDPIGAHGQGVAQPFSSAINPSRMCAAYNDSNVRISVQNGADPGQPHEDWWFDMNLGIWTGPHSFPATVVAPYYAETGNEFLLAAVGVNAKLFVQNIYPELISTYVENGANMSWVWQPSLLPDNQMGAMNAVIETTQAFAMPDSQQVTILALDEDGNTLDTVALNGVGAGGGVWGSMTWGTGVWGGSIRPIRQYRLPWSIPLVFKQGTFRTTGVSELGFAVGNLYLKYSALGYDIVDAA